MAFLRSTCCLFAALWLCACGGESGADAPIDAHAPALPPLRAPSSGGVGFASYYCNDNAVYRSPAHRGDGIPDRNSNFGGCFVNAGDPKWYEQLAQQRIDGPDGVAGFRELLTGNYGRGFGFDGVFLDTLDTAAPNGYSDANSPNMSKFEWTAPGFANFIRRVRKDYPDK